ncbi:hypothetical protein QTP88_001760 [Uroleucon formosanum]
MLENFNNISEQDVTRNTGLTAITVLNNENIHISNEETLHNFETLLESSTQRDKVVSELSLSVGKTISETIKRMIQKLFHDNWFCNYSNIGSKAETIFHLYTQDVRSYSKFEMIPDMEIAQTINKWMAQATNRIENKEKL